MNLIKKPIVLFVFYRSIIPTVSAGKNGRIIFSGTPFPNKLKLLELYKTENPRWTRNKLPWDSVPGRDDKWLEAMQQSCGDYFKTEILLEYD